MRILNSYWFDVVLASLLAFSAILLALTGGPESLLIDLPACAAAALATRWPKVVVPIQIAIMFAYLLIPVEWKTLGEYAPWIPILTCGMRGKIRARLALSLASVVTFSLDSFRASEDLELSIVGSIIWLILIAALWLIGNGFQALRQAQQKAARVSLVEQRLELARGLHDTVARELGRASMAAQQAQLTGNPAELAAAVQSINDASADLRRQLLVLRQSDNGPQPGPNTDLVSATQQAWASLDSRGFVAATNIEQPLAPVPDQVSQVLLTVVREAVANIEKHAAPASPCALFLSVTEGEADLSILNRLGATQPSNQASLGLLGLQEQLSRLNGTLTAARQWVLHAWIPLGGLS